jgi:hypothetical protein
MITFREWQRALPGTAVNIANASTGYTPGYQDDIQMFQKLGAYGGLGMSAGLPVVLNNPQYIDDYIDFADMYGEYSRALGHTQNVLNAGEFLRSSDAMSYAFRPGTMANVASQPYISNALGTNQYGMPYLGLARGVNSLTRNQENPYGAIPILNNLEEGISNVTRGLNESKVGQFFGDVGERIYDQSIGRLYGLDTGLFRGAGRLAQVPGEFVNDVTGGVTGLFREGYQFLDKNVFGGELPGGAITKRALQENPDLLSGFEESNSWQNPFEGMKDLFSGVTDSFKSQTTKRYEGLGVVEKGIVDRFIDKGFSKKEALNIFDSDPSAHYYGDGGQFLIDIQTPSIERARDGYGYTEDQIKEVGKYMNSLDPDMGQMKKYNDAGIIPYVEKMDGVEVDFDDDFAMNITLKEYEDRASELEGYGDLHVDLADKFGNDIAKDLLGENALSDDVLDIINSDLDPQMSIQDAKDWSDLSNDVTNYDAVAIDLTEKERYDIAVQNNFDKTEYNDHIKWLDTQEIKDVNTRVQELVKVGKNLNDAQITELSNLADRQQKFATSASLDAEVNNFVDDLYGDANQAITDARNEQARVAKAQAEATKKALEEAKAEQARKAQEAEQARKAEQARQAEAKRQADLKKQREAEQMAIIRQQQIAEQASRQATQHAIQQARDFGNNIGTYRGGGGTTNFSGGYVLFGCWVAREVYGVDNPKWLQFRDWMFNDAPSNIRESYIEHGESIAKHISDKPELKSKIRRFMDSKIGG